VNENGNFVLNPITYSSDKSYDNIFDFMLKSFVPSKIEYHDLSIAIDDINKSLFIVFDDSNNIAKMDYNGTILETIPIEGKSNINYYIHSLKSLDIERDRFNDDVFIFILDQSNEKAKIIYDKTNKIIRDKNG
jgi:hypothetical protein